MRMRQIGLLVVGMLAAADCPTTAAAPNPDAAASRSCGDLLAEIGRKPPSLVFVRCDYRPDRQGKPLEAHYRVAGQHAEEIERYFGTTIGLPRLRWVCCGWEAPPQWFRDSQGRDVMFGMGSGETIVNERRRWHEIPAFEVTVEILTEEI